MRGIEKVERYSIYLNNFGLEDFYFFLVIEKVMIYSYDFIVRVWRLLFYYKYNGSENIFKKRRDGM